MVGGVKLCIASQLQNFVWYRPCIVYTAVVVIGFDADTYSVNESDGSLTVYVQTMKGRLKRSVIVEVSLINGHALGEIHKNVLLC